MYKGICTCTSAMYGSAQCNVYTDTHTCTEGTCTSAMYSSVQCDAYTHAYIHVHVLKVQCVSVHWQLW